MTLGPFENLIGRAADLAGLRPDPHGREAESLMHAVVDVALDAVVVCDGEGRITLFNPAAERIFGRRAEDALGRPIAELVAVPGHDADPSRPGEPEQDVGKRLSQALGRRVTLDGRRSDGSAFPAEIAIHRVGTGGRVLYAANIRDLSAEREAAEAIERQRLRLAEIERFSLLGSLLGGIAHELNNPMAILVAQASLLRDKAPDADVARRAERIDEAARRAGRIVKGFAAMARQTAPSRAPLDLNDVIETALDLVSYGLRSAGIAIEHRLAADLPAVQADRDLMVQVFATVMMEGRRALLERDGRRRLAIRSYAAAREAIVEVENDAATGFPTAVDRLFETTGPGGRVGAASDSFGRPMPLGLLTCRTLVEAHAGRMGVEGGAEHGSLVRVALPIDESPAARHPSPAAPDRSRPLSLLVVDDEREVAEALAELMEVFGHRASIETSPDAALARLGREVFDAIFVDYRMPGCDGLTFRARVRAADEALAARTVLVTGDTGLRYAAGIADAAAGLVLEKPFTAAEVRGLLAQLTGLAGESVA